jgi:hypothetical protein
MSRDGGHPESRGVACTSGRRRAGSLQRRDHELRARGRCVPRRYVVVDADGLVRAAGYTDTRTCLPGEPFLLRVAKPLAA